jgi:hypothetical protein
VRQIKYVDISRYSFEEFVDFVFDHDVPIEVGTPPTSEEGVQRWYFSTRATIDLERLSAHYTRLFSESARLLRRFPKAQLEHGFSAIQSGSTFSVRKLIWNMDLAFHHRERCVRSMFFLFRDFFSVEPLRYTANMWWDGLCFVWEIGQRQRSRGGEDATMQDVMFVTMSEILGIDSDECRYAALHGLSHLHHPATLELIEAYRSTIPGLERWCDAYNAAEAAWRGRVEKRSDPQ